MVEEAKIAKEMEERTTRTIPDEEETQPQQSSSLDEEPTKRNRPEREKRRRRRRTKKNQQQQQQQQQQQIEDAHGFPIEEDNYSDPPNPIHVQNVIDYLKPVREDFQRSLRDLQESNCNNSISQLSFTVNDSAFGNKTFQDTYDMGAPLGEGGFAIVYKCHHKVNHKDYAVKVVYEDDAEVAGENVKQEIATLKLLQREGGGFYYIVSLLDVFYDNIEKVHYLIMEELKGGDLLDKIYEKGKYEEKEARKISRLLLEAIEFCHKKYIVHRDIKPENILLVDPNDDTHIKLADFGCAKRFYVDNNNGTPEDANAGKVLLTTMCGSPQYVAPEIYVYETGYDEKCDLWSLGIVMYVLLGGYCPFESEDNLELVRLICEGYFEFHSNDGWDEISASAKEVISMMLKVDPTERGTINDALSSPWLERKYSATTATRNNLRLGSSLHFPIQKHNHNNDMNNNSFRSPKSAATTRPGVDFGASNGSFHVWMQNRHQVHKDTSFEDSNSNDNDSYSSSSDSSSMASLNYDVNDDEQEDPPQEEPTGNDETNKKIHNNDTNDNVVVDADIFERSLHFEDLVS